MSTTSEAAPPERLVVLVQGRVQGVGFRYATERRARALELTGYVRNKADGSVLVVAEGVPERLGKLLDWMHRGPPGARVTAVQHHPAAYRGEFRHFSVAY